MGGVDAGIIVINSFRESMHSLLCRAYRGLLIVMFSEVLTENIHEHQQVEQINDSPKFSTFLGWRAWFQGLLH